MSNSYVKQDKEVRIRRVVTMVESWDDPDELIEYTEYQLWLGDDHVTSFGSLADLIQYGGDYLDG